MGFIEQGMFFIHDEFIMWVELSVQQTCKEV